MSRGEFLAEVGRCGPTATDQATQISCGLIAELDVEVVDVLEQPYVMGVPGIGTAVHRDIRGVDRERETEHDSLGHPCGGECAQFRCRVEVVLRFGCGDATDSRVDKREEHHG